jgi:hypothetical protein
MSHAGMCVEVFAYKAVFQFRDLAFLFVYPKVFIQQGDSGAVISPVFKAF